MKRIKFVVVTFAVASLAIGGFSLAHAADTTGNKTNQIRANCRSAQSDMQQISKSDTGARINRGRAYDKNLKLMATFNARLTANHISAPRAAEITDKLQRAVGQFRDAYDDYEDSMDVAIKTDCAAQPVTFYENLVEARTRRAALHQRVVDVEQLINDYFTEVEHISPVGGQS